MSASTQTEMEQVNFADAPVSISEARAFRDNDCSKLSPRDLLIGVLREIDSGEYSPNALVVCWSYNREDGEHTRMRQASPHPLITSGLLSKCVVDLWA